MCKLKVRIYHIEKAMSKIKPLSKEEIDGYQQIADKFGKPHRSKDNVMGVMTQQQSKMPKNKL